MHIGIDVGGTNTDSVLMDGRRLVASAKQPTTGDVTEGITAALRSVLSEAPERIEAVSVGTTHFTNAVVQGRGLARTAAVRLGLPASAGVPPMTGWPQRLSSALGGHRFLCHGGYEYDGREISPLDPDELKRVAEQLGRDGVESAAITSIFSPVNADLEQRAAEILRAELPDLRVSLSHEIGRIGLVERENATIINAALLPVADRTVDAIGEALRFLGIDAPLYLSQNDGTLMDREYVRRYPVATFAAGPTNSMRGAALLSGLDDCVVVDIGGTTADVGAVVAGFPRQATTAVDIAGVRTNFRMPDVVSVGIGGGSLVTLDGTSAQVGPESVGYRLPSAALVFGGGTLTATDVAVAAGAADIGDRSAVRHLDPALVRTAMRSIAERIGALADTMRTSAADTPVVLVGGGSVLLPGDLPGFNTIVRPGEHASVANAIGAAIAQVGGEVDRMFVLERESRERALEEAKAEAIEQAVAAGADPRTVEVVDIDEIPISYLPGGVTRVRVKAVGELALGGVR
ncbi:hydantoinase/oxoprolinase N-terminal domain-containing protein [Leucobacter tenebrionis]|uniref:hydantoinase/oxoprolinase N-terminal domain-containing protein n=1 Tax=Leucobacter tenebrionis TaxID=2873270 RepID=UPI001CA6F6F9|nr:hydantoinase/oxoprolinase family protein [Leucobacter tenebrionis]QZY51047.1 hydantoinase/oxoprolinase family protein [Leucobacter tenebrionis]